MKKTKLKKVSQREVPKLKRKLWTLVSLHIRQKYADENGVAKCYTCGQEYHWKALQAGHFISRTHSSTLFDLENLRPQCFACNIWKRGNAAEYSARLIEEIGLEKFKALIARGREIKQWTAQELQELIEKFTC